MDRASAGTKGGGRRAPHAAPQQYSLTLTTTAGQVFSFTTKRVPRNYKSWLMHEVPYGTTLQGASFKCEIAQ